jgi:hypothetical protein
MEHFGKQNNISMVRSLMRNGSFAILTSKLFASSVLWMIWHCPLPAQVTMYLEDRFISQYPMCFSFWVLHHHGPKAQVVYFPIGITGAVFITELHPTPEQQ